MYFQDGRKLGRNGPNYQMKKGRSKLAFTEVRASDGGTYWCRARNSHGTADSEPAELFVQGQFGKIRCVSLNIFHSGIEYTENDWVRLKVQHYPLQKSNLLKEKVNRSKMGPK